MDQAPPIPGKPYFHDDAAAYAKLESIVWPNGPVCVHCGETYRIGLLKGTATRPGVYKCYACRKQFRVTVGTVLEASHIPLRHWLKAFHLTLSSNNGITGSQLQDALGITPKSALLMGRRIRGAIPGLLAEAAPKSACGDATIEPGTTRRRGRPRKWTRGLLPPIPAVASPIRRDSKARNTQDPEKTPDKIFPILVSHTDLDDWPEIDEARIFAVISAGFRPGVKPPPAAPAEPNRKPKPPKPPPLS